MPDQVLRNEKIIPGAVAITVSGSTATVDVEVGSELDGLLYYNATRDGRPRLVLRHGDGEPQRASHRFQVGLPTAGRYELTADRGLET